MLSRSRFVSTLGALALLVPTVATQNQVVIAFTDFRVGATVSDLGIAVFSSTPGFINVTADDFSFGTSPPNYLCTATAAGVLTCENDTYVDFPSPVNGLTFWHAGDDAMGQVATVNVFESGILTATEPVIADGDFSTAGLVDLTSYSQVTRIEITNITDPAGLAWDDFSFETSQPTPQATCLPGSEVLRLGIERTDPEILHVAVERVAPSAQVFLFLATELTATPVEATPGIRLGLAGARVSAPLGIADPTGVIRVDLPLPADAPTIWAQAEAFAHPELCLAGTPATSNFATTKRPVSDGEPVRPRAVAVAEN